MQPGMLRTALILGLLSAVGPFAIDMYLPAMPTVAADLNATPSQAQNTLVAFFVAFGIAQLFYGPWADHSGRKPPLYFGLALFLVASIGCALVQSITALILLRFVQGLGAAVVMVVPRAVIRDLYTGPAATRLFALVMLVISVSPMLAPLAGSGLIAVSGWRLIFWVLAGAALLSLLMTLTLQPETLAAENRVPFNLATMLAGSRVLLTSPRFLALTFIGGLGIASFFVFIAIAPFIYQGLFGLSPTGFSLAFAANAIGFFAASQMAAPLGERLGMDRMVRLASWGFAGFNVLLTLLALAGLASLPVTMACLLGANAFVGLIMPTTMVMSLDDHGDIAGLASSLGGTLQMVTGGIISTIAGLFHNGTVLPMAAGMLVCALGCLILAQTISRPASLAVRPN